jgi:putative SOS response-associated peptidase YedK
MQWGFHRQDGAGLIINTRSETALDHPLFRPSMLERRCLIPASWYFEWEQQNEAAAANNKTQKTKAKNPRRIKYLIRCAAPGPIYLAGIYRYEEGRRLPVFSILTREPAPEIAFIHGRMPVIFSEYTRSLWLDGNTDPISALRACEQTMAYRPA